ncbi:MAG: UvrB/UvrC motif-containing protein [Elusimicrobiota bacterium]
MKCESCKKENFTVLLKMLVNGRIKTLRLCDACAAEKGYSYEETPPTAGDYAEKIILQEHIPAKKKKLKCPSCSTPYLDFSRSGRLGCPLCYFYFEKELSFLLGRLGSGRYQGRAGLSSIRQEAAALNKKREDLIRKKIKICLHFNDFKTAEKLKKELWKIENEKL